MAGREVEERGRAVLDAMQNVELGLEDGVVVESVKLKKVRVEGNGIETTLCFRTSSLHPTIIAANEAQLRELKVFLNNFRFKGLRLLKEEGEEVAGLEATDDPARVLALAQLLVDKYKEGRTEYDLEDGAEPRNLSQHLRRLRIQLDRTISGDEDSSEGTESFQHHLIKKYLLALSHLHAELDGAGTAMSEAEQKLCTRVYFTERLSWLRAQLAVVPQHILLLTQLILRANQSGGRVEKEELLELEQRTQDLVDLLYIMSASVAEGGEPELSGLQPLLLVLLERAKETLEAERKLKEGLHPDEKRVAAWNEIEDLVQSAKAAQKRAQRPGESLSEITQATDREAEILIKEDKVKDATRELEEAERRKAKDEEKARLAREVAERDEDAMRGLEEEVNALQQEEEARATEELSLQEELEAARKPLANLEQIKEATVALGPRLEDARQAAAEEEERRKAVEQAATEAKAAAERSKQEALAAKGKSSATREEVDKMEAQVEILREEASAGLKGPEAAARARAEEQREALKEVETALAELGKTQKAEEVQLKERKERLRRVKVAEAQLKLIEELSDPDTHRLRPSAVERLARMGKLMYQQQGPPSSPSSSRESKSPSSSYHTYCCVPQKMMTLLERIQAGMGDVVLAHQKELSVEQSWMELEERGDGALVLLEDSAPLMARLERMETQLSNAHPAHLRLTAAIKELKGHLEQPPFHFPRPQPSSS